MDEYIVHVLVPETGVRLIAEDRSILSLVEARKVMQDSVEFGNYMQDIHDVSQNIWALHRVVTVVEVVAEEDLVATD